MCIRDSICTKEQTTVLSDTHQRLAYRHIVTFMVALLVACLQNKKLSFDEKLVLMGRGVGDKNIITMILIFLVAGVFVGVTGRNSAEAVAYFLLSIAPAWASVAVLFVAACFTSLFHFFSEYLTYHRDHSLVLST